ncbi:LysE family translocator [Ectothiorhodospira lacustris]|uniref:LysE family translocator n=1 Tax=Ectothiorhodospira lacustris TaxID=2899127 RepID=UPI001EE7E570|nr:LysE family transporter [Ectothiorhodospira lacustris]MCG5510039.1 LysE family transporter [Ectothiorhodospira lacustris]MCG5521785.1 LysE family transporter [Ectothiorhodospira lacustris]
MIASLSTGMILGFSAGMAPGPLLALVISETLQYGARAGIKVALAPVLTDLPIILLTLFVLSRLSGLDTLLGLISLGGGVFLCYLAWQGLTFSGSPMGAEAAPRARSLQKAVLVNVLSPHPYLFWLTVGGPVTVRALEHAWFAGAAFIGSFYLLMVGAKMGIAVLVGRSRRLLCGRPYIYTMRALGGMLLLLALFLLHDGLVLIGVILP